MFEEVQHRQQGPQARRERGQRVLDAAFHLPTAEADERRSRGVRPGVLAAGDAPHRGAGHRGHPQPPGDCRRRFLLPGLDLLSAGLQQLEQLLDVPAPVVPQRDCLRVDLGWNIRQQEPRRQNPAIRRADFREHQPQGRRRARNPISSGASGSPARSLTSSAVRIPQPSGTFRLLSGAPFRGSGRRSAGRRLGSREPKRGSWPEAVHPLHRVRRPAGRR